MFGNVLKIVERYAFHARWVTITSPSSWPINWAVFIVLDASTIVATSCKQDTGVRLYFCLIRPNPPSGRNLVCPEFMKLYVIDLWRPVITLHSRYQITKLFLFCPVQLSACNSAWSSPIPQLLKKWSSRLITSSDPFWITCPSSMR